MGYNTDFEGEFVVTPTLKPEHLAYLVKFSQTRRTKRNPEMCASLPDPIREATGLPVGIDGGYFVGYNDAISIISYLMPPIGQPSLSCKWIPNEHGSRIRWNKTPEFYHYTEWIKYLINNFFIPWGYQLNGEVKWHGGERDDFGIILIENNNVRSGIGEITYRYA